MFYIKKSLFQTNQIKEILNTSIIIKDKKRAEIILKLNDEKFKIQKNNKEFSKNDEQIRLLKIQTMDNGNRSKTV
jgi:hypothetical protein